MLGNSIAGKIKYVRDFSPLTSIRFTVVVPLAKLLGLPSLGRPDEALLLTLDIREWKNDFHLLGCILGTSTLSFGGGISAICAGGS